MNARQPVLPALAFVLVAPLTASAQFAVQQPVVGLHSVSTTVSVPDRGGVYLGGVGSAAYGRSTAGPFRSGYGFGMQRAHSGMSVHARIHDLSEMDRALLGRPTAEPPLGNPNAEHAWRQLSRQPAARSAAVAAGNAGFRRQAFVPPGRW